MRLAPLVALAAAAAAAATSLGAQQAPPDAPPPIEDNSFLIEEAYNQERGVVQHISTFAHATTGRAWGYSFTQEWPVPDRTHQLSYTVPFVRTGERGASPKVGDVAINYRWQAHETDGVLFAPRLSVLLPTGSASAGAGTGGAGIQANLPLTLELSPKWVTHSNVGGTLVPNGKLGLGHTRVTNLTLGQSAIFLARPTLNFMLEALYSRTTLTLKDLDLDVDADNAYTLSPGLRWAINVPSGLQIVPGVALPITWRRANGETNTEKALFLYLSLEHAFRKR